jgi:hypothetical protein
VQDEEWEGGENMWFLPFLMKQNISRKKGRSRKVAANKLRIISLPFSNYLAGKGYALRSIQHYSGVVDHFGRWMACRHYLVRDVSEKLIARFYQVHLPRCQCPPPAAVGVSDVRPGLHHLLVFLRQGQMCPPPPQIQITLIDRQVADFDRYLGEVCGLSEATRRYRRQYIHEFLKRRFGQRPLSYERLKPKDLLSYVHQRATTLQPSTARLLTSSLRSFLRYLQLENKITPGLENAILAPAARGIGALPKVFTEEERNRLTHHESGASMQTIFLCKPLLGLWIPMRFPGFCLGRDYWGGCQRRSAGIARFGHFCLAVS